MTLKVRKRRKRGSSRRSRIPKMTSIYFMDWRISSLKK